MPKAEISGALTRRRYGLENENSEMRISIGLDKIGAMSPYTKGALFLIRLAGAGFIFLSVALLLEDVALLMTHRPMASPAKLVLKCLPLAVGTVICWKSGPMARRLTQDLDE